jgi:sec-independent protein translocase protein TatA
VPGWIGPWELAIVLIVVLLIFGPKRLPQLGRSLGRGARELKNTLPSFKDDDEPDADAKRSERDSVS